MALPPGLYEAWLCDRMSGQQQYSAWDVSAQTSLPGQQHDRCSSWPRNNKTGEAWCIIPAKLINSRINYI